MAKKRIKNIIIWIMIFSVLIVWGAFFQVDFLKNLLPQVPTVIWWNFDLNQKKIPFNSKNIDFTFSENLDEKTIIKENINISPKIEWIFSLAKWNIIRFSPKNNLKEWEILNFTFSEKIKSKKWKNIVETTFELQTVSNAKVVKITPSWDLKNLSQNFVVFFNIPMVPLTDLDSRDELPCPISFKPEVKWKCSWTTTSVLEFIPEKRLFWATDYEVTVRNDKWLLYSLEKSETITVKTPRLSFNFPSKFNASKWLNFTSNFDVSLEEIKKSLVLSKNLVINNNKGVKPSVEKLDLIITKNKNNFNVKLKKWNFNYNTTYYYQFKNKINSINWNIVYNNIWLNSINTYGFLNNVQVYNNIYSETWALINTKKVYLWNNEYNKYISIKNLFFNLTFEEEVLLNKNSFSFVDDKWKKVNFNIEYIKEEKSSTEGLSPLNKSIVNKKRIKLILKQKLDNNKTYKLIISKNINKYLKEDINKYYNSSKKLEIKDFKFINYWKSCVYLSNPIDNVRNKKSEIFESSPKSWVHHIWTWDWPSYNINKEANKINDYNKRQEFLLKKWYCPKVKSGEYLYVLYTRLNPNTDYELKIKNDFEDKYWNKLDNLYTKKVKTGNILEKDKYLYSWVSKDINVIPNNLPIIINLKTINLEKVNLWVCEMDELWYMDYVKNHYQKWFSPKCLKKKSLEISVKNRFWNITNNRIDLEEDFLKEKFSSNFILVKWKKINWENKFSNIYIRENLSVTLEDWANKQLLFVNDFKWNVVTDVEFSFYKYDYKSKQTKKVKLNPVLNKKTSVFELDAQKSLFDYVVVSWGGKFWFLNINRDYLSNYWFNYISGNSSSQKKFLYLYTERPIYKPGDTVFVKWLLREFKATWYTKTDIKNADLELIWPSWKTLLTNKIVVWKNSNFDTKFIIPKDVSLWKFRFRFKEINWKKSYIVGNNAYFDIEEYRKPTFKVEVDSLSTEGFSPLKNYILWDKLELKINPQYYFGWKMINTTWNYSVLTQNYFFDAKDYSDYQFGEWYAYFDCIYWGACSYQDELIKNWDFKIDNNWEFIFKHNFVWKKITWEKIYNFSFEVTDPNTQRTVTKRVSKVLHNTDAYVWIKSKYYNSIKEWININWIILDFDAKALAWKKVKLELIKRDWKSVKKKWVDGIFYNEYALEEKLEKTISLNSDKKWEFSKNIKPQKSGEYEIKLTYTWTNNKEFVSSTNIYVAWNDYVEWHNDNNDITEFVAEKVQVKIWDKAEYMLKTPINSGKALIVIEKDNDILDYFVHDIKTYSDKIIIDVKNTYYPNYYVKAFLIWEQKGNPLPVYKRALIVTKVNTDYKNLNVEIKTNKKEYLPWAQVALEIKVTDYKWTIVPNTDLSISLVDESLLALKWNPKKNPYAFFYDLKRFLWITTYSSLKNLIEKLEVKNSNNWEKWWAWESVKWWDSKKKRWTFKDTAFWQANVTTDKNWIAKITTAKLPDNLTTWVIEVLANTASDTKVWINYETIITSKKLLISDNLPRFFGSNDEIILSPVVFNKTGKSQIFRVSLDITNANILDKKIQNIIINKWDSKTVNFKVKIKDIGISENKDLFNSKVNIKAVSSDKKYVDEIEKFVKIKEVSTPEFVSTFWKTDKSSFEEKISVGKIKNSAWKLKINYSATLLTSILDWIEYLNRYPYGCSEQKTSAIMPNIFIKQLYNSAWKDFDLSKKMVKYWISDIRGYWEKSLDQIVKEYLVNIRKYQKSDGWFVYFYDVSYWNNYSNFALTSFILESWAEIEKVWYKLDKATYNNATKYLKTRFYKNYREWCRTTEYNNCKYSETSRLKAISAILEYNKLDYEAYKMYKLLDFYKINNSLNLEKVKLIAKLTRLKDIQKEEKDNLLKEAEKIVNKIISEELVFNPKGSYLWKTNYYSRFRNTVSLLEAISIIWLDKFKDIEKIIDNMNRWIISQKKDWSFGSTADNIALIKAITKYLESSWELKWVNNFTKLKLNNKIIAEKWFDDKNKLEVFLKTISLDDIQDENSFVVEKQWKWTIYYDLNLSYYKDASEIKARDEGFFVETKYFSYNEYKKIESLKEQEWEKYLEDKISYDDLKYPKEIINYLTEVKTWKVWQLLIANNKIITTETRDKVAFEWFIPAGSELINPNLATSRDNSWIISTENLYFSKKEYRFDRLFAYKDTLYPWIYNFTYLIRLTHSWKYSIKPTRISEFYNVEVFGRNWGKVFEIK